MIAARQAGGPAGGVLDGMYPNPAAGLPVGGVQAADDFVGAINKTTMRTSIGWSVYDFGGGVTISDGAETATEIGNVLMQTGAALADGGNIATSSGRITGIPVGTAWAVKIRQGAIGTNINVRAWSGFADTTTPWGSADWASTTTVQAVGVRVVASGSAANWYGVCKNGASSETTVDLGVTFDTTWRWLGFKRTSTGIQFFTGDASAMSSRGFVMSNVGSEITTTIPTVAMYWVAAGIDTAAAAAKSVEVDMWALGGAIPR